ncbi:MAG: DUF1835 domain-containing protein [Pyrinomonadaceae bacterium]|nr:DUF1835 domain-containing protein [Pyrinomonadaceae bacterium]
MIYHVLPGDSLVDEFRKTKISGDVIVCRECMVVGDVSGDTVNELFDRRANFLLVAYGTDEIEYHEKVADELLRLIDLPTGTEVHLWFEYELFCQANYWFCLYLLAGAEFEVYRVEPSVRLPHEIWNGFGGLDAKALKSCYRDRKRLSADDRKLGIDLWIAYSAGDYNRLRELSKIESPCFPQLSEVVEAEIEKSVRPAEILREIRGSGVKDFAEIFVQFTERAGVYGFGDTQVAAILDQLS